ncbi:hypothetical protein VTG60DRAFT_2268 [Thermothelomyces hinnuleus]
MVAVYCKLVRPGRYTGTPSITCLFSNAIRSVLWHRAHTGRSDDDLIATASIFCGVRDDAVALQPRRFPARRWAMTLIDLKGARRAPEKSCEEEEPLDSVN